MTLSIIIPTCNRNDLLDKCLQLLSPEVQIISDAYEIIVTDDSKDGMAKNLIAEKYSWVKWVEGPHRGPASNRNNGAKNARGEWFVFIDDDCLPLNNILDSYKAAISNNPGVDAFEGAITPDNWELLKEDMSECPVNTEGGCFWSANVCINKALFEQIGGFDESFLLAAQEDQDIYIRLKEKTNVVFIKEALVVHPVRKISLTKKIKQIPAAAKNWYIYEKKYHPQKLSRVSSMCLMFSIELVKNVGRNLVKGKVKTAAFHFFSYFVGVPVYLKLIKDHWNE